MLDESPDVLPEDANQPSRGVELAVLAFACLLPTVVTLAYFVWSSGMAAGIQQGVYGVAKAVQFALPVVWVGWFCREKLGLPIRTTRGLGLAIAFGLLVAAAIGGLYWGLLGTDLLTQALEPIHAKIKGMELDIPWVFIGLGVFYSLIHSLLEEYYWRWFVFRRLTRHVSLALAVGISAAAFALHHVVVLSAYFSHSPGAVAFFSLSVAVGGAVWAWLYHRNGSLLGPWLSHMCVDAAIFAVGYHIQFGKLGLG